MTSSAQESGYMGYIPYTITPNNSNSNKIEVNFNYKSLNSLTDLVVVDMVRGGGFSNNFSPQKVDFAKIADDFSLFVESFIKE